MRRLTTALLALTLVPAAIVLPTVSAPAATPHPVAPAIEALPLTALSAPPTADAAAGAPGAQRSAEGQAPAPVPLIAGLKPAVYTEQRTTKPFDLAAVTWDAGTAPAGMVVRVRLRERGAWSAWTVLPVIDEGPEPGSTELAQARARKREGTDPLTTEHADGVQIRIDSPTGVAPKGVSAQLIDGGRSDADAATATPAASAQAAAPTPTVITRAQWGADESLRTGTPSYNSTVKALVLHHTAGSNSYTQTGAYAELRATYAYHTASLGWSDIGYNIVLDRYGRIYEGRKGSITQMVVGAHAGGFNSNTFGFSVMGNFEAAAPPAAVVSSVKAAMAWKAQQFGINANGTTTLTSAGGGTSKYAAGTVVTKPTIMGHLDLGYTACPGKYLYPSMGAIRSYIASVVTPGGGSISGIAQTPASVSYGTGSVRVTATVPVSYSWSMKISSLCSGLVRTITGTAATGALTATWDLKNASNAFVPPGIYTVETTFSASGRSNTVFTRDVEVLTSPTSPAPTCSTVRLAGSDRYNTAIVVGRTAFPSATSAVLVSGQAEVDGVVAAPFAYSKGAPLLLTTTASLVPAVSAELTRRHVTRVWIVGGPSVVSTDVEAQLRAIGVTSITRLAGADRYGTARAVAMAMPANTGAIVASGNDANLIDAVGVGGAAARTGRPILLTRQDALPADTVAALSSRRPTGVNVIGSSAVVGDAILSQLATLGATSRVRLAGADRYATAAAVARAYTSYVGTSSLVVAPGGAVVDALVSGQLGQLTLLAGTTSVPTATQTFLTGADATKVTLVGGPDRVSTSAMRTIAATVG